MDCKNNPIEYHHHLIIYIVHGSAPEYLKQSINLSRGNHYDTRSENLSCVMPSVKGFGIKSFFYSAS